MMRECYVDSKALVKLMPRTRHNLDKALLFHKNARTEAERFERIIREAQNIEHKVKRIPALHRLWKDVLLCLELVRDYRLGRYTQIASWAIAAVAFGLLYLVNPVELIPDVIPIVGYLDDIVVFVLILRLVRIELRKYASWRKNRAEYEAVFSGLLDHE